MRAGGLVERGQEIDSIGAALAEAVGGDGRVVLVEGPAGIGKTRLLGEVRAHAAATGALTLAARASELERSYTFGVVRQLFEAHPLSAADRERLLAGAAAPATAVFSAPPSGPDSDGHGDASFATLHGLYWLALNLAATTPLILLVDDLQWCDRASLRFLAYLGGRLEGQRILVAASLRSAELGTDPALIAEIAHGASTVTISPGPLSARACAQVVYEQFGDAPQPDFIPACHAATGGNPLLLGQLLSSVRSVAGTDGTLDGRVVHGIGARAVSRHVALRMARLPPPALAVARAVAVLGDRALLPSVATLSGVPEHDAAELAGALARAEILRFDAPLGFVHPLVRDAVYGAWAAVEREQAHERAARILDEAGADPEEVAAHILLVPGRGRAWVTMRLHEAARISVHRGAPDGALAYLLRALEEPAPAAQRAQLLLELGLTEVMADGPAAVAHLRAAYDGLGDDRRRARAAHALAQMLIFTGAPDEAARFARRARADLPAQLADDRLGLMAIELITLMFGADDPEIAALMGQLRGPAPGAGPGAGMLNAVTAMLWAMTGHGAGECAQLALDAIASDDLLAVDTGFFTAIAIIVLALADREEAVAHCDRMLEEASRRGSLFAVVGAQLWRAETMLRRGELAEAEELARASSAGQRTWGLDPVAHSYQPTILSAALREQGDLRGARDALGEPPPGGETDPLRLRAELELLLAESDAERALAMSNVYRAHAGGSVNPGWAPWRTLRALALDRAGRTAEAVALAVEELEPARRWGAPGTVGRTLRIIGTLKRGDGVDDLEEAVHVLQGSPARLEHAKALAAFGTALRVTRGPAQAREPLRRAHELARTCGAQRLAEHVRSELAIVGARPRARQFSGVDALTASERRVAGMAADGLTNREIAQALFVTPKTVDNHLTRVYPKLGITSRRALPQALHAGRGIAGASSG